MAGMKNVFSIHRNEECIDCGARKKTCHTYKAGLTDFKRECYMCMLVDDDCSKNGISYGKKSNR